MKKVPEKKWRIEIEPVDEELKEFRPWPHMVISKAQEVSHFTYKLMWGDECVLEAKMFAPVEFMVTSDLKSFVDFGRFLEEVQQ